MQSLRRLKNSATEWWEEENPPKLLAQGFTKRQDDCSAGNT